MKYTLTLIMTLVLVLTILPVDQAQAQALGNSAEQAQDHKRRLFPPWTTASWISWVRHPRTA